MLPYLPEIPALFNQPPFCNRCYKLATKFSNSLTGSLPSHQLTWHLQHTLNTSKIYRRKQGTLESLLRTWSEASHPTRSHDTCNTDTEHKKNLQEQGTESLLKLTNEHKYFTGMQTPWNLVRLISELSLNSAGIRIEPAANGDDLASQSSHRGGWIGLPCCL